MLKDKPIQTESVSFIMDFDRFTDFCGHFFCYGTTEGYKDCANINNGYNCSHPEQEEVEEDELTGKEAGKHQPVFIRRQSPYPRHLA